MWNYDSVDNYYLNNLLQLFCKDKTTQIQNLNLADL